MSFNFSLPPKVEEKPQFRTTFSTDKKYVSPIIHSRDFGPVSPENNAFDYSKSKVNRPMSPIDSTEVKINGQTLDINTIRPISPKGSKPQSFATPANPPQQSPFYQSVKPLSFQSTQSSPFHSTPSTNTDKSNRPLSPIDATKTIINGKPVDLNSLNPIVSPREQERKKDPLDSSPFASPIGSTHPSISPYTPGYASFNSNLVGGMTPFINTPQFSTRTPNFGITPTTTNNTNNTKSTPESYKSTFSAEFSKSSAFKPPSALPTFATSSLINSVPQPVEPKTVTTSQPTFSVPSGSPSFSIFVASPAPPVSITPSQPTFSVPSGPPSFSAFMISSVASPVPPVAPVVSAPPPFPEQKPVVFPGSPRRFSFSEPVMPPPPFPEQKPVVFPTSSFLVSPPPFPEQKPIVNSTPIADLQSSTVFSTSENSTPFVNSAPITDLQSSSLSISPIESKIEKPDQLFVSPTKEDIFTPSDKNSLSSVKTEDFSSRTTHYIAPSSINASTNTNSSNDNLLVNPANHLTNEILNVPLDGSSDNRSLSRPELIHQSKSDSSNFHESVDSSAVDAFLEKPAEQESLILSVQEVDSALKTIDILNTHETMNVPLDGNMDNRSFSRPISTSPSMSDSFISVRNLDSELSDPTDLNSTPSIDSSRFLNDGPADVTSAVFPLESLDHDEKSKVLTLDEEILKEEVKKTAPSPVEQSKTVEAQITHTTPLFSEFKPSEAQITHTMPLFSDEQSKTVEAQITHTTPLISDEQSKPSEAQITHTMPLFSESKPSEAQITHTPFPLSESKPSEAQITHTMPLFSESKPSEAQITHTTPLFSDEKSKLSEAQITHSRSPLSESKPSEAQITHTTPLFSNEQFKSIEQTKSDEIKIVSIPQLFPEIKSVEISEANMNIINEKSHEDKNSTMKIQFPSPKIEGNIFSQNNLSMFSAKLFSTQKEISPEIKIDKKDSFMEKSSMEDNVKSIKEKFVSPISSPESMSEDNFVSPQFSPPERVNLSDRTKSPEHVVVSSVIHEANKVNLSPGFPPPSQIVFTPSTEKISSSNKPSVPSFLSLPAEPIQFPSKPVEQVSPIQPSQKLDQPQVVPSQQPPQPTQPQVVPSQQPPQPTQPQITPPQPVFPPQIVPQVSQIPQQLSQVVPPQPLFPQQVVPQPQQFAPQQAPPVHSPITSPFMQQFMPMQFGQFPQTSPLGQQVVQQPIYIPVPVPAQYFPQSLPTNTHPTNPINFSNSPSQIVSPITSPKSTMEQKNMNYANPMEFPSTYASSSTTQTYTSDPRQMTQPTYLPSHSSQKPTYSPINQPSQINYPQPIQNESQILQQKKKIVINRPPKIGTIMSPRDFEAHHVALPGDRRHSTIKQQLNVDYSQQTENFFEEEKLTQTRRPKESIQIDMPVKTFTKNLSVPRRNISITRASPIPKVPRMTEKTEIKSVERHDYEMYPVPGEDSNYKSRMLKKSRKSKKKQKDESSESSESESESSSEEEEVVKKKSRKSEVQQQEQSRQRVAKFASNNIYLNPGTDLIQYNLNDFTNEEKEKLRMQLFARYENKRIKYPHLGLREIDPNISLNLLIARCEAIEDIISVSNKMDKISVFITISYAVVEIVLTRILKINATGVYQSCMSMIKQFEPIIREFADAPIFNMGSDWNPMLKLVIYNAIVIVGIVVLNTITTKWLPFAAEKSREYINRFLEGGFAAFPELNRFANPEKRRPTEVPVGETQEATDYSGGVGGLINGFGSLLGLGRKAQPKQAEPPRRAPRAARFDE